MTIGLARALRLLVAIGLFLGPLAPMSANCAPIGEADTAPSLTQTALASPSHDCCSETDQAGFAGDADLSKCKIGCIAVPGMTGSAQFVMTQLVAAVEASFADRGIADWSPQPLYDPPILRS